MRRPVLDRWSGADMVVLGVATVRGEAVPVISLGRVLGDGGDAEDASSESHMLVLRLPRRLVGLCVDRVLGVHTLGSEAPADLPPLLRGAHAEHVTHLARLDGELLLLLEAGRLLPRDFGVDVGGGTA
jgi:purine-binding chemotaxis protein CheW